MHHSCQKSGSTGSRIAVPRNEVRRGVYISGTPIWDEGRDPLNFGSMTPVWRNGSWYAIQMIFFAEDKSMQIIMTENIGPQLSTTAPRQLTLGVQESNESIVLSSFPQANAGKRPNSSSVLPDQRLYPCLRRPTYPSGYPGTMRRWRWEKNKAGVAWDWDHPVSHRRPRHGDGAYGTRPDRRTAAGFLVCTPVIFPCEYWVIIWGKLTWNGIVTRPSTHVDPLSFLTLDPGRSTQGRGTRHQPSFWLLHAQPNSNWHVNTTFSTNPTILNN
jgi:hypothetical protein